MEDLDSVSFGREAFGEGRLQASRLQSCLPRSFGSQGGRVESDLAAVFLEVLCFSRGTAKGVEFILLHVLAVEKPASLIQKYPSNTPWSPKSVRRKQEQRSLEDPKTKPSEVGRSPIVVLSASDRESGSSEKVRTWSFILRGLNNW